MYRLLFIEGPYMHISNFDSIEALFTQRRQDQAITPLFPSFVWINEKFEFRKL